MGFVSETSVIAHAAVFLALNPIFVLGRFWMRWKTNSWGLDDWFCIPALVFSMSIYILMIIGARGHVFGSSDSPEAKRPSTGSYALETLTPLEMDQLSNLECFFEPIALACIKISLLCFYRRIFIKRAMIYTIWILIGITGLWGFAYCLFQLIACWEQIRENFHNGGCPYIVGPGLVYGVVDVAVDTAIFIIPMPLVTTLLVPWRRKVGILFALLIGSLAIVYAYVRLVGNVVDIGGPYDTKELWGFLLILTAGQMGIGMIAICLPIMGPPLISYLRRKMASAGRGSNVSGSEPLTVHAEKAEKAEQKNKPTTLGSVNTQDLEAYAKGRIHGDENIQVVSVDIENRKEREYSVSEPMESTTKHDTHSAL